MESEKLEQPEAEKSTYSESFSKKIEGKTEEELKAMLYETEKYSGKLSNELGELRSFKRETETPKTSKDIKSRIEKTDSKIANLDAQIKKLDPELDDDEIADLEAKKQHLFQKKSDYNQQHMELFVKEIVDKNGAGEHNKKVSQTTRESFKEKYGQEFSDDDWSAISGYAESVSKDFKVEPEDYEYAIMKAMGMERYKALNLSVAETKIRNNIEKAEKKAVTTVGGKSKNYMTLDLDGMSDQQVRKALKGLSDKQLKQLKEQLKGQ